MQQYEYMNERVSARLKLVGGGAASQKDTEILNDAVSRRAAEGWEYVSHTFKSSIMTGASAFNVTFRRPMKGSVQSVSRTDNVEELIKFKKLLDSGVISQKEFDAKKQELL